MPPKEEQQAVAPPPHQSPVALDENFLADHIEKYLQADDNKKSATVFSAVLGGIHVYVFPPSKILKRHWYTLVTMGVSGTQMKVPERIDNPEAFERCELMCYLPADWAFPPHSSMADQEEDAQVQRAWPIDMLRSVGYYIVNTQAWFSQDHGVPSLTSDTPGAPFASNTKLSAMVTLDPCAIEDDAFNPVFCNGKQVNFLLCVPVTAAEAQWKREVGVADSVWYFIGDRRVNDEIPVDYVIDAQRPCCVEDLGYREKTERRIAEGDAKRKRDQDRNDNNTDVPTKE